MKNKSVSVIAAAALAMTSFVSLAVTASAEDSDYTITIPSTLSVANPGWNSIGNIEASGTLSANKKLILSASSENEWALKSGSNSVSYTMKEAAEGSETTSWEFTSLPVTQAIGIDVEDYSSKPAGTYTDTVTFTASVEDAKPEYYDKLTSGAGSGDDQVILLKELGRGYRSYNSSLTAAQAYALATYQAAIDGKPVYVIMSSQDYGYDIHYALSTDAAATEHVSDIYDLVEYGKSINMYYVAQ